MQNPFRYGLIVDSPYFTDRVDELRRIVRFLDGENHLVMIFSSVGFSGRWTPSS